jgi:hypothetical protein
VTKQDSWSTGREGLSTRGGYKVCAGRDGVGPDLRLRRDRRAHHHPPAAKVQVMVAMRGHLFRVMVCQRGGSSSVLMRELPLD